MQINRSQVKWDLLSLTHCYRPQTKLREGNVFTPVCHSVHGGLPVDSAMGHADPYLYRQTPL